MEYIQHISPLLIPIIAIVMGIGIGMLALTLDFRKKSQLMEMHHRERMLAIERGIELPPLRRELEDDGARLGARSPARSLRSGLVLLFVGITIATALYVENGGSGAIWGLIPAAVGLAHLIYYFVEGRRSPPPSSGSVTGS